MSALALVLAILPAIAEDRLPIHHFVLALSWQPAFCQYNPHLPECGPYTDSKTNPKISLTLHGLWSYQENGELLNYCSIDEQQRRLDQERQWCEINLPPINADIATLTQDVMPGTASCLDRHEWLKHGTCSGLDANRYFLFSARLAQKMSMNSFSRMLEKSYGGIVTATDLKTAFEEDFGRGTSLALSLRCREDGGRPYLSEIWIRLNPEAVTKDSANSRFDSSLLDLREAKEKRSCPAKIYIDAPGL